MSDLIRTVEQMLFLPEGSIKGPGRSRPYVQARGLVAVILRERGLTYPQIGDKLGGRDHSTAIFLVRRYPEYAAVNPALHRVKALFNPDEPLILAVRHAREQWVRDRNKAVIVDIRRNQPPIRIMKRHRLSITAYEQLAAQVRAGLVA